MKKLLAILLGVIIVFSLASCFEDTEKPSAGEEVNNQTLQQEENKEENKTESKDDKKHEDKKEDEGKPAEYAPTAWIKDNTSISFYLLYNENNPDVNQLLTFKILDGKAVLYSKKGDGEEQPITIYEETDEGIVVTQLLHIYDSHAAIVNEPNAEHHDLAKYLPQTGNVMATFGARAEKDSYKDKEITGTAEYLGRKCNVIEKDSGVTVQTTYLDKETGIILKNESVTGINDTESRYISCYVTAFEYGTVTEDDVTVDLSDYKVTYEGEEENPENNQDERNDESVNETNEIPVSSTKTLAYFEKYLSGGEYTMEMKTTVQGIEVISKNAFKDDMMYSENDMDGMKSVMVMRDGYQYIIENSSKMVLKTQVVDNGAVMDMFADEAANYETAVASGETEYNGKSYDYEEFTVEGETVQYLFDGDELKFIKATVEGEESIVEIISLEKGADAKLFEIPEDYQMIAY